MVARHAWRTVRADRCAPHARLQKLVLLDILTALKGDDSCRL